MRTTLYTLIILRDQETWKIYDFVANYEWYGKNDNGERKYSKLTKPRLPNHKLFDAEKENEREDYCYSLLLLFVPLRDESNVLLLNKSAEEAFNHLLPTNVDCSGYHDKLQKMLKAQSNIKRSMRLGKLMV